MKAMVLDRPRGASPGGRAPLARPGAAGQVLVAVDSCGVCRTDLHVVDGELPDPKLPLVPGPPDRRARPSGRRRFAPGDRVGIPWLGWTDGECRYCLSGRENLCDRARFTGYQLDGGYAEQVVADERFCFPSPRRTTTSRPPRSSAPA